MRIAPESKCNLREFCIFATAILIVTKYEHKKTFRYNPEALAAHLEDSNLYECIGERWKVDVKKLCRKIRSLSSTQVDAIYRRVETFWEHSTTTGLDTWAKF